MNLLIKQLRLGLINHALSYGSICLPDKNSSKANRYTRLTLKKMDATITSYSDG